MGFFLAVLAQSLLPFAHWNMAVPDLAVLYLAFLVTLQPRKDILVHGLALGIVWDLVAGVWVGYHTFSLLLFALFLHWAQGMLYMDRALVFFSAIFTGVCLRQLSLGLMMTLRGLGLNTGFLVQGLSAIAYTLLFAFFLYALTGLLRQVWASVVR